MHVPSTYQYNLHHRKFIIPRPYQMRRNWRHRHKPPAVFCARQSMADHPCLLTATLQSKELETCARLPETDTYTPDQALRLQVLAFIP